MALMYVCISNINFYHWSGSLSAGFFFHEKLPASSHWWVDSDIIFSKKNIVSKRYSNFKCDNTFKETLGRRFVINIRVFTD